MVSTKKVSYKTQEISHKESLAVRFLYNSIPGRILLSVLVRTTISKIFGVLLDCLASRVLIRSFVKNNNIDMSEYANVNYKSFNDFFTREIKKNLRPLSDHEHDTIAPCDGKLTAYQITSAGAFCIKSSMYTIESLLKDKALSDEFMGGVCLIFRLTPDDYHRYVYIDNGESLYRKRIKGVLHTVRPISQQRYKVFVQNTREYEVLLTENFGKVIQIEVGALFVGRISNHKIDRTFKRGDEKGMFEFGGSTIIILLQKNAVILEDAIFANTQENKETIVRMGCKIGEKNIHGKEEL